MSGDEEQQVDELLGAAVDAVPEGSELARFLKQFGYVGLVLGVLVGNIAPAALTSAVLSGRAGISTDTFELYWSVFVVLAPWVAVTAVAVYCLVRQTFPQMSGPGYLFAFGGLVAAAALLSTLLGGPIIAELDVIPNASGPAGAAAAGAEILLAYFSAYGPLAWMASLVEGAFLGYWAAVLGEPRA